jgi:hypothetical protein
MEKKLSPSEFLEQEYGIKMETTTLITYLDGVMKQPSLSFLMNEYCKYVIAYQKVSTDEDMQI